MKRILLIISVLIAVCFVLYFTGCRKNDGDNIIKIGIVMPMTGPNKQIGIEMRDSAHLIVEEWNTANKIKGYKIEILERDDASDPKQALTNAKFVIGDNRVVGVLAHLNSGCLITAMPEYEKAGIAAIGPSETNTEITKKGWKTVFRVCTTDNIQTSAIASRMAREGHKKISIVHDSTDYGLGLGEELKKYAEAKEIEVVNFIATRTEDKNYRTVLVEIKSKNPDAIFFGGVAENCGILVKQMREAGMQQVIYSPDGTKGPHYIELAGDAAEGAIVTMVGPKLEDLKEGSGAYFEAYKKKYGVEVQNYGPYAYDAVGIILTAIKNVVDRGEAPTRSNVLEEVRKTKYAGVLGITEFDEFGDTKNKLITFYIVKNGEFVPLETVQAE